MDRRTALKTLAASPFIANVAESNAIVSLQKDKYNLGLYSHHLPKIRANSHLMDFGLKIQDTCELSENLSNTMKSYRSVGIDDYRAILWSVMKPYWNCFSRQSGPADEFRFYGIDGRRWPTWFVFESLCLARTHGNDTIGWLNGEEIQTAEERYRQNFKENKG